MPQNHLIHEKSPYLEQHARNPVDWYPWGPEAMDKARAEQKPIFLSIGYSTCHWCHVMEHESFENEAIAAILNRYFVSIKVDREERPDIDRIYMSYVQAATGSGGWPMSVWLTPDGRPFVGGTYFPPDSRYGRPGFADVLNRIARAWDEEHERIVESTGSILQQLESQTAFGHPEEIPGTEVLDAGFAVWRRSFDSKLGGFGQEPKFPRPAVFDFLLRYWVRTANPEALEMVKLTLHMMAQGGMNDQLGGGFHRYSVDAYWFVPHFEKMLYDQAQIAMSLVEIFQITHDADAETELRRVCDYVLRDMTDPEGGFYSAEDADSAPDPAYPNRKSEGAFYIWTAAEIQDLVGPEAARYFGYRYGVRPGGNVENDPHGEFTGRNILFAAHTLEETAHHFDQPLERVRAQISEASAKLLAARSQRPRPHLDDKVLTSWNGLMISALARAGAALNESRYTRAARRAVDFLITRMWDATSKTLLRRYRRGDAAIPGFLDDYAFLTRGLLDLYETQFREADLALALGLAERMCELFEDRDNGAFFSVPAKAEGSSDSSHVPLLLRMKDDYDGAEPSGNAIATASLLRLERMTGRTEFGDAARRALAAFSTRLRSQPFGVPLMMNALDYQLSPPRQIVIAGDPNAPDSQALLREIWTRFQPHRALLLAGTTAGIHLAGMLPVEGRTAAYVCENFTCQLPITDPEKLAELLQ